MKNLSKLVNVKYVEDLTRSKLVGEPFVHSTHSTNIPDTRSLTRPPGMHAQPAESRLMHTCRFAHMQSGSWC